MVMLAVMPGLQFEFRVVDRNDHIVTVTTFWMLTGAFDLRDDAVEWILGIGIDPEVRGFAFGDAADIGFADVAMTCMRVRSCARTKSVGV